MKKSYILISIIFILVLSASCGAKKPNTSNNPSNNNPSTIQTPNNNITSQNTTQPPTNTGSNTGTVQNPAANTTPNTSSAYIKEFPYLPNYKGLEFVDYKPATANQQYAAGSYIIRNTTDKNVFENYQNALKKDGWKINQAQKYYSITAQKGTHYVAITLQKAGNDVRFLIAAR